MTGRPYTDHYRDLHLFLSVVKMSADCRSRYKTCGCSPAHQHILFLPPASAQHASASFLSAVWSDWMPQPLLLFLIQSPNLKTLPNQFYPGVEFVSECRPVAHTDVSGLQRVNQLATIQIIVFTYIKEKTSSTLNANPPSEFSRSKPWHFCCLFKTHSVWTTHFKPIRTRSNSRFPRTVLPREAWNPHVNEHLRLMLFPIQSNSVNGTGRILDGCHPWTCHLSKAHHHICLRSFSSP